IESVGVAKQGLHASGPQFWIANRHGQWESECIKPNSDNRLPSYAKAGFGIPIVALWFLLKDITVFYFTANIPQHATAGRQAFHPRFSLTAIPFSNDEGADLKKEIRKLQFETELANFVLPHHERERRWLTKLIGTQDGQEVALPDDGWVKDLTTSKETFDSL